MKFGLIKRFSDYCKKARVEFYHCVEDLLLSQEVQSLEQFVQHQCFTRLRHSMDVAYFSFFIARLFRWDSRSAARGGLLHDLFYYDWREHQKGRQHAVLHPRVALENARKLCSLNKVEEDIIRKHMWLVTLAMPRYKESFVVTFVDKYCAAREFVLSVRIKKKLYASNFERYPIPQSIAA